MVENVINVRSIEDNCANVNSLEDRVINIQTNGKDIIYIKEKFNWLDYKVVDWVASGDEFLLTIPKSIHKCDNPFLDSMLIKEGEILESNIAVWSINSNGDIIIRSYDAIDCKVLIKGDTRNGY